MPEMTVGRVAALTGGEVRGDAERAISAVAPLERATGEALSFVASVRYLAYLQATRAAAVLVTPTWADQVPEGTAAVIVEDPHAALHAVLVELFPPRRPAPGVHPTAIVHETARIDTAASVGPGAVIEGGVVIGAGSVIGAHAVICKECRIGADVTIHPHATLYPAVEVGDRSIVHSGARVGKEGFGYVWKDGGHRKIPQVGGCVIEEDVEIGTNVTIDRGSIGDTVIGAGTKIDNLVHLGHNVQIGQHVLLISQVGISGSTAVGNGAVLAGQAGVAGHLTIGDGAQVGAQAGVISDVPAGATYSGYPARPHLEALRAQAGMFKLPKLVERLKRLEAAVFGRGGDVNENRND